MMKKWFFLSLFILIPVLLVLFLKFFGKNAYEIPVYYEQGVTYPDCSLEQNKLYTVAKDEVMTNSKQNITLVGIVEGSDTEADLNFFDELGRRMDSEEIKQVFLLSSKPLTLDNQFATRIIDEELLENIAMCTLLLSEGQPWDAQFYNKIVLIDSGKRIRGYYSMHDLSELDRILVEMDILRQYGTEN